MLTRCYSNSVSETLKLTTIVEYEKDNTITFKVSINNDKLITKLLASFGLTNDFYSKQYLDNSFKYSLNNINQEVQEKLQVLQIKNIIIDLIIVK